MPIAAQFRQMSDDTRQGAEEVVQGRMRPAFARTVITWLALGFAAQHSLGMLTSLLCFENELYLSGTSKSVEWWPGDPDKFWTSLDWFYEVPLVDHGELYPGMQPPIAIDGTCGTIGVWRNRHVRGLYEEWAFVSPVVVAHRDGATGGLGWASLEKYEQWLQSPPDDAESDKSSAYYLLRAYLQQGKTITLDPPSWVVQPKCRTESPTDNPPVIMQYSAAWGAPFRSVVHHARYRWLYDVPLPEQSFLCAYPGTWERLDYDGIPRTSQMLLFNAGVGWRPIWIGGFLNAVIYGGVLFVSWKCVRWMFHFPKCVAKRPFKGGLATFSR